MDFLCVFLDTNFLQRLVLFKVKIQMKLEENSHHAIVLFFFCSSCFQYAMHQTIVLKNSKGRKLHFCSSRLIILIVALQSIAKQYCTSFLSFARLKKYVQHSHFCCYMTQSSQKVRILFFWLYGVWGTSSFTSSFVDAKASEK